MKHKPLPTTALEWKGRAAQIQRALPPLLYGDKPPKRPKQSYRVLAHGEDERHWQQARWDELTRLYPETPGNTYQFPGPVTWTTQVIEYEGWPGHPPQRAILRTPKHACRAPALLCLHGHSRGLQLGCVEVKYFAEPLTAMGYVTLAPEAMPFGDRRLHVRDDWEMDHQGNLFWDERVVASECWLLGETLMGRQIWELMASVDLLQSLPQVDPNRIGSIGCSQGGIHTWWLSILDKRIAAGVVSAAVSNFRSWIDHRAINALMCYVPGILKLADQDELLAIIAPRPLLLLDCAQNGFFPREGMERVGGFLGRVYRWHGAGRSFTRDLDPNGHGFPERQQQLAFQWLKRHLPPDATRASFTSPALLRRAGHVRTNGNRKVHGRLRLPRKASVG